MATRSPSPIFSALAVSLASIALAGCATGQLASGVPGAGSSVAAGPALEPESFVGQNSRQLETRLGPPDYRREEASAQVWQYRLDQCVVDFVLYRNGSGYRIEAWNGRHRTSGRGYDHDICRRELGRLESF